MMFSKETACPLACGIICCDIELRKTMEKLLYRMDPWKPLVGMDSFLVLVQCTALKLP